jgi:hypothetical protein
MAAAPRTSPVSRTAAPTTEGGIAYRRKVGVGISTWEAVEIVSGLAEGATIATSLGALELTDGMRVSPQPGGMR